MTMYARCISICIVEISHFRADAKTIFAPHWYRTPFIMLIGMGDRF